MPLFEFGAKLAAMGRYAGAVIENTREPTQESKLLVEATRRDLWAKVPLQTERTELARKVYEAAPQKFALLGAKDSGGLVDVLRKHTATLEERKRQDERTRIVLAEHAKYSAQLEQAKLERERLAQQVKAKEAAAAQEAVAIAEPVQAGFSFGNAMPWVLGIGAVLGLLFLTREN